MIGYFYGFKVREYLRLFAQTDENCNSFNLSLIFEQIFATYTQGNYKKFFSLNRSLSRVSKAVIH